MIKAEDRTKGIEADKEESLNSKTIEMSVQTIKNNIHYVLAIVCLLGFAFWDETSKNFWYLLDGAFIISPKTPNGWLFVAAVGLLCFILALALFTGPHCSPKFALYIAVITLAFISVKIIDIYKAEIGIQN